MSVYIDRLDASLQRAGEDAIIRRVISSSNVDCPCRVHVRSYRQRDDQIVNGSEQAQEEFDVIMSPTEINNAGWPAGGTGINPSIPRKGDYIIIKNRQRAIEVVDPISVANEIVRIEIRTVG